MYADYAFYKNEYKGRLTEEEYTPLAEFAGAYIDSKTDFFFEKNGQPGEGSSLELRVKRCACVLADEKHLINTGADRKKTSEKVGNYSVGYSTAPVQSADERLSDIILLYIPDIVKVVRWI